MVKLIYITFGLMFCVSCAERRIKTVEESHSEFDLKTDLTDFKEKMTELDTLIVSFDHSVCTYQGYEKIRITKKNDSLVIQSDFRDMTFENETEWKKVYNLKLSVKDTIWKFPQFLKRNATRRVNIENSNTPMTISNGSHEIGYYTDRLQDLIKFQIDFYKTMRELYPENKYEIYGVEIME